jgi:hypothetical protein
VLGLPHGIEKMKKKGEFAQEVLRWSLENIEDAKTQFSKNAKDVINNLLQIEKEIDY